MKKLACVIFDLDGTLTQTNELIYATFNHVAEKYVGRIFTPKEISGMFGPPEDIAIERLVGKDNAGSAMDDFYHFYETHHSRMAEIYEGMREILQYLQGCGVVLAVFTGKGKRSTLITLEKIGIKQFFDMVVTGHDVREHKPSADGIRKVLQRFGCSPDEALMVGDAVADVKAAQEAEVPMAAVLWDSYAREKVELMEVDYKFYSVADFSAWIRNVIHGGDRSR